ncbi:MAG TPA: thiamine phosphate synthase [Pyrinomonadaceae bacterium]
MRIKLPQLYPITDARLSGLSHAEQVERFGRGGATLVQLREKHQSPREFYRAAEEALARARQLNMRLIINDRVDIALAIGADGVHLGQDDLPPAAARELLGDEAIIGFSTHTLEQASAAARMPVDYIAIGPIFNTSSKENPDAVVGLEGLRSVRRAVGQLPLVAIGGITDETARSTIMTGADSIAVISLLLKNPANISAQVRELLAKL